MLSASPGPLASLSPPARGRGRGHNLALALLTELVADGSLPTRWVVCDEGYGRSVDFLDGGGRPGPGLHGGSAGRHAALVGAATVCDTSHPATVGARGGGLPGGGLPGPDVWLVLRRRSGADPVRVFLCHAPRRAKPAHLARLTGTRWAMETCFQEGKQLLGLGDYEGRSWQGWHHHTTLCMLLHFFLLRGKLALQKSSPA